MAESRARAFAKLAAKVNARGNVTNEGLAEEVSSVIDTSLDSASVENIVNTSISDYVQLYQSGTLEITSSDIRWLSPVDITIISTRAVLGTAASGSDCVIALKRNDSSIDTLTISDGSDSATNSSLSLNLSAGDYLTHDITTASGSDLNLIVEYTR